LDLCPVPSRQREGLVEGPPQAVGQREGLLHQISAVGPRRDDDVDWALHSLSFSEVDDRVEPVSADARVHAGLRAGGATPGPERIAFGAFNPVGKPVVPVGPKGEPPRERLVEIPRNLCQRQGTTKFGRCCAAVCSFSSFSSSSSFCESMQATQSYFLSQKGGGRGNAELELKVFIAEGRSFLSLPPF